MCGVRVSGSLLALVLAACNVGELVLPDAPAGQPDAPHDAAAAGLAVTPAMHDFAAAQLGTTSGAVGFTTSSGSTTGALAVSITGPDASDFAILGDGCAGLVLTSQSPCTTFVALRPTSVGAKSAQLEISGAPGGAVVAALSGTGIAPAQAQSIAPATHGFGSVAAGTASSSHRFTVTNTGSLPVGPMTSVLVGGDAGQFAIDPVEDHCSNKINAPGASCTVDVRFAPTSTGTITASLAISPLATATVATLTGTGLAVAALDVSPMFEDFGTVSVGIPTTATFTVRSVGLVASAPLTTAVSAGDFAIVADTCAGSPLAPGATCIVHVRCLATGIGPRSATLDVGGGTTLVSATMVANALFPPAGIVIAPTPHAFADTQIGASSAQTFTITNVGGSTTGMLMLALGGTGPGQFAIPTASNHCLAVALTPAASCAFDVVFAPTSTGPQAATVTASGTPGFAVAALSGRGVPAAPLLHISPEARDFGTVIVTLTSATQVFTVTNTGNAPTSALTTTLSGTDPGEFEIIGGTNTCAGASLAPGATCSIHVRSAPTTAGPKLANLAIGGAAVLPTEAALSASAAPLESLSVSPSILTFTNVVVGTTSAPQTFVVENQGPIAIPSLALTLIGNAADQYQLDPTSPCIGASLAPGGTCTGTVRFLPTSAGAKHASVQVVGGGLVTVALNGTAIVSSAVAAP
jgi:hypothetical protein